MPRRLLWCRHDDCHEAYVSDAGKVPGLCPACGRAAKWSTERPDGLPPAALPPSSVAYDGPDPQTAYTLTRKDLIFLMALRIDPEQDLER